MKNYSWKVLHQSMICAKGSIRTKRLKRGGKLLRICCPKKKWNTHTKRCRVGTLAYEIGTPKR